MPAARRANARDGQAEDRDERVGIARAARCETGQLAIQAVVDVARGESEVDGDRDARIRWRGPGGMSGRGVGHGVALRGPRMGVKIGRKG